MKRKLTEEDFSNIITRKLVYKQSNGKIAQEVGVSEKSVKVTVRAFQLVRDDLFDELVYSVEHDSITLKMIDWAARELHKKVPKEELQKAYERRLEHNRRLTENREKAAASEATELADCAITKAMLAPGAVVEEKKTQNDALYMIKILEALNKQNELFEQLLDVVMPKYASDIKDNLNANTDVICERLKNCETSLDKIACNSRKRGL